MRMCHPKRSNGAAPRTIPKQPQKNNKTGCRSIHMHLSVYQIASDNCSHSTHGHRNRTEKARRRHESTSGTVYVAEGSAVRPLERTIRRNKEVNSNRSRKRRGGVAARIIRWSLAILAVLAISGGVYAQERSHDDEKEQINFTPIPNPVTPSNITPPVGSRLFLAGHEQTAPHRRSNIAWGYWVRDRCEINLLLFVVVGSFLRVDAAGNSQNSEYRQ